ncbi:MAG TPA: hypothetical protein VN457_07800, partial [Chlamydiales bacterium]|nr:hypothetical protein [Chlamydiales bacterium]
MEKAEAQAREAQIEASLERVRARSMAMHHSSELHAAADVLFQQLRIFGGNILNAGIALCTEDADEDEYWLSSDDGLRPVISIPHTKDSVQKKLYEDWKNKSEFFSIVKEGDELRAHYNYLQSVPSLKPFFEEGPHWSFPTWQKWHAAYFSHGYLFMITLEPYEDEKILVRFARVFEQAYRRFLDLKKAEAQAREAQIEASLEKVRSSAMAMHNSNDISSTTTVVFAELKKLGIHSIRCGICLLFKESFDANVYAAAASSDGGLATLQRAIKMSDHPVLMQQYESWLKQENYINELKGQELRSYYRLPFFQSSSNYSPPVDHGQSEWGYYI